MDPMFLVGVVLVPVALLALGIFIGKKLEQRTYNKTDDMK